MIPAHNEESRLPRTLRQVFAFLEKQEYTHEVLVIENASMDRTLEIAQRFVSTYSSLKVIHEAQLGKGFAVRRGMLEARGSFRFICDADLSMPIEEISKFLPPLLSDFDIAIGSRESPGSVRYNEPAYRHWGGRAINLAVRMLILPGLNDTQCGFKCIRAKTAESIFREQTLPGWSFDIEMLYLARRRGDRLKEVPIDWYFDPDSKVSPLRDAIRMVGDIFWIHANALRGRYDFKT